MNERRGEKEERESARAMNVAAGERKAQQGKGATPVKRSKPSVQLNK